MSASVHVPRHALATKQEASAWGLLYRTGSIAAVSIAVFIPIQSLVFILWPPPTTVIGWFGLFHKNALLGLLDMDLLLIVDQILTGLVLLALYGALTHANRSLTTIAVALGLGGVITYFASSVAFNMLALSQQYATATTATEKTIVLAAGQATLTQWTGTAFDVGYILEGVGLLLIAVVMLNSMLFSKAIAWVSLVLGVMSLVPPSVGTFGMIMALGSLVPLEVWEILIARRLWQLGQTAPQQASTARDRLRVLHGVSSHHPVTR